MKKVTYIAGNQYDIRFDDLYAKITSNEYNDLITNNVLSDSSNITFSTDESVLYTDGHIVKLNPKSKYKLLKESCISVKDVKINSVIQRKDLLIYKNGLFVPIKTKKETLSESCKIFEEKGITDNIEDLIQYISEVIYKYGMNRQFNSRHYLITSNGRKIDNNGYTYSEIEFSVPDEVNTAEWMLPFIRLKVRKYISNDTAEFSDILNNAEYSGIYSNISLDKISNDINFTGGIECNLIKGNYNSFYIGQTLIEKESDLYPFVRHELNHVRKKVGEILSRTNIWLKDKSEFEKKLGKDSNKDIAYTDLLCLINDFSIIGKISKILYMFCVPEEQQANIEQFYQETEQDNFNDSDTYKQLEYFESFIDRLKTFRPNKDQMYNIYNKLKSVTNVLFCIKSDNPEKYWNKLLLFIDVSLKDMRKRLIRANKVSRHRIFREDSIRY